MPMYTDAINANLFVSVVLVLVIYMLDRAERESPLFVIGLYLTAILATYIYGNIVTSATGPVDPNAYPFYTAFFRAGFLEELLKFAIFMAVVWPSRHFNEEMDGIVYCIVIALGFSVVENIIYTLGYVYKPYVYDTLTGSEGHYGSALINILLARSIPGHVMFATFMGFFVGKAGHNKKPYYLATGFFAAVALHGVWDYLLFKNYPAPVFYAYAGFLFIATVFLILRLQRITKYRRLNQELVDLMDSAITTIRQMKQGAGLIRKFKAVRKNLKYLGNLEGSEQDEAIGWIRDNLPVPVENFFADELALASGRLDQINATLLSYRQLQDKFFFILFAIGLFVSSCMLIVVMFMFSAV